MKKPVYVCALLVAASFLLSTPASADVLYDNGLVKDNIGSSNGYWGIYYNYVVSDSFTLAGTSTLTGVNLGIWIAADFTPEYLSWRISDSHWDTQTNEDHGTQAFLTDVTYLRKGSVTINNNIPDVYFASFSLPDVVVGPGTHFLTLDWGYGDHGVLYWDVSNGPSAAYQTGFALADYLTPGSHSNSFQILGDGPAPTGAPEPASVAMLLSGLALVAGLARRKIRA
jgi:hypothetical protein